jgi:hypothetical protein
MGRQQFATLLDSTIHRGRKQYNVLRFSSRPLSQIERHRHQRQHRQWSPQQQRLPFDSNHACNSQRPNFSFVCRNLPSFHLVRARYFSNAVERNHKEDGVDNADSNRISTQLAHLFVEEDGDQSNSNYLKTLKSWYLTNHGEVGSVVQDAFDTKKIQNPNSHYAVSAADVKEGVDDGDDDNDKNGGVAVVDGTIRQIFTATFTCPLTNERFEAGRLAGFYDIDDQNFYSRKKIAIQAVSAVVLSHKMNAHEGENGGGSGDATETDANYSIQSNNDQSTFRQVLQRLYMKHYKISPTQSQRRIIKQDFVGKTHGGTWWTAEFTCPITGRTYESADLPSEIVSDSMKMKEAGQIWYRKKSDSVHASAFHAIESIDWNVKLEELVDENSKANSSEPENPSGNNKDSKELLRPLASWYEEQGHGDLKISINDNFVLTGGPDDEGSKLWTSSFLCPLTGERFDSGTINSTDTISNTEIDDLIWYTEKDAAIRAASQRAYDIFKYRFNGVKDPRFCKEDPGEHSTESFGLSRKIDGRENIFVAGDEAVNDDDNGLDQDEDEFVIEVIPQQFTHSSGSLSGSSKTLDIIAQAWIDSTGPPPTKENANNKMKSFQDAFNEREKAILRALEWVSRQDKKTDELSGHLTQFDIQGEVCNLKIVNAILSSLAECHQRVPFDSQPTGVEECAAAVVESMWSSHSTKPDAHSYAFFMKCLEGETPSDVAAKAQEIVNAMESGDDYYQRPLPRPNAAVYSSLAELMALAGMNSSLESNDVDSLDRNTHLSKLSAMAHDPTTFDIEIATKLIDHMKTLAETNGELSLQPDLEIYNAPLRWSGGHIWSRLYSRVIPWDSYSEIYKDGFKSVSGIDVEQKHAESMEQWIEMMTTKISDDSTLAPNIETYESLIQAWVRCGNLESLQRAETIARNIIAGEYSDVEPRIQTFYPILAAWTNSGCEEGPQKAESWIDLLEELAPDLEPRLAFPNVPIMAQISLQRQMLKRSSDPLDEDPSQIESRVFDSAMKCSEFLQLAIERYKGSPDSRVQSDVFMLAINSWYNAASAAMLNGNLEGSRKCFREIQKVVDEFDNLVVWLYQVEDGNKVRTQFLKLFDLAPSVYGAQLAALSITEQDLGNYQKISSNDYDRTMQLFSIEEKIRRLEEFHLFWGDDDGSADDSRLKARIDINDTSVFPSEGFMGDLICASWSDYIDSSLDILEKGAKDSSIGQPDLIRLSMLITRVASSAKPSILNSLTKGHIIEKVVNILENYCRNDKDKEAIISSVIQSLQKRLVSPGAKKIRTHSTESKHDANNELRQEKARVGHR